MSCCFMVVYYILKQNLLQGHFCHPDAFINSMFDIHYHLINRRPNESFSVSIDKSLTRLLDQFIDHS